VFAVDSVYFIRLSYALKDSNMTTSSLLQQSRTTRTSFCEVFALLPFT